MAEASNGSAADGKPYSRFLIPCRVVPGMFQDEWLVLIDAIDSKDRTKTLEVQMFADARDVVRLEGTPTRGKPVKGWVRVQTAGTEDGLAWILLPQFAQPVGTYLLISKDLVEQETAS